MSVVFTLRLKREALSNRRAQRKCEYDVEAQERQNDEGAEEVENGHTADAVIVIGGGED